MQNQYTIRITGLFHIHGVLWSCDFDFQIMNIKCMFHGQCRYISRSDRSAEEVVHASLSVIAMSRVQQNLLFSSSTYLQPTGRGDGALQVLVAGLWQGL